MKKKKKMQSSFVAIGAETDVDWVAGTAQLAFVLLNIERIWYEAWNEKQGWRCYKPLDETNLLQRHT